MWCVSDTLVTYFWIKRDICGVTVGDLCNISVISLLFCTNVTKSYQKYTKKVPLNFYGKIGHLGPLKCPDGGSLIRQGSTSREITAEKRELQSVIYTSI